MSPPTNPASAASLALRYLDELGAGVEIANVDLANAIGARISSLPSSLAKHVRNGLIVQSTRGRSICWSLPPDDDGKPVQRVVPAKDAPPLVGLRTAWPFGEITA